MSQFFGFCLTFCVGALGFIFFHRFRIPGAALLGSMFTTGILNIAGYFPVFPTWAVSFVSNAAIGVMLGRQIDREVVARIRRLARYVFLHVAGMLVLSLISGYVLYRTTTLTLGTALLSGTAGGISEMTAFGLSINEDVVVIAFIQLFRVVVFLALIPCLSRLVDREDPKNAVPKGVRTPKHFFALRHYILLIPSAFAGALIAQHFHVPAGAMLGAMVACGACVLSIGRTYRFDTRIRYAAQIGLGLVMGERMQSNVLSLLSNLFLPALGVTLVMLAGCTLLAFILHKTSGWDFATCLLCSAPAGLSQASVFAEEMGVDSFTASVFHTVRIVGIVSFYPWLIMPML